MAKLIFPILRFGFFMCNLTIVLYISRHGSRIFERGVAEESF